MNQIDLDSRGSMAVLEKGPYTIFVTVTRIEMDGAKACDVKYRICGPNGAREKHKLSLCPENSLMIVLPNSTYSLMIRCEIGPGDNADSWIRITHT